MGWGASTASAVGNPPAADAKHGVAMTISDGEGTATPVRGFTAEYVQKMQAEHQSRLSEVTATMQGDHSGVM